MADAGPSLKEVVRTIQAGKDYWDIHPVRDAKERLKEVAKLVVENRERLEMGRWFGSEPDTSDPNVDFTKIAHTCGTTACIAGWAILLAGEDGKALLEGIQKQDSSDPEEWAGFILLGQEANDHFFDEDGEALEFLQGVLREG